MWINAPHVSDDFLVYLYFTQKLGVESGITRFHRKGVNRVVTFAGDPDLFLLFSVHVCSEASMLNSWLDVAYLCCGVLLTMCNVYGVNRRAFFFSAGATER